MIANKFLTLVGLVLIIAILAVVAIGGFWLWHTLRDREYARILRTEPISRLAARVREAIQYEGWDHFKHGAALMAQTQWTEEMLLSRIENLYVELLEEDGTRQRSGRESNSFEFHDSGLVWIAEALRDRIGNAKSSDE